MKAGVAEQRTGVFGVINGISGFLGRVLLPLGLFSVLAVGLHVGSDKVDDHLFVIISWIDSLFDAVSSGVIHFLGSTFGAADTWAETWSYRAAELIDLDMKGHLARVGALVVELFADVLLALPVLFTRAGAIRPAAFLELVKKTFRDPTVLKIVLPFSIIAAGLAGTFAISREVQVLAHSSLAEASPDPVWATFTASAIGFVALALIVWRVLTPLVLGAIVFADRRSNNDLVTSVSQRKRRMRGWLLALTVLPVATIALLATNVLGTLGALLWM